MIKHYFDVAGDAILEKYPCSIGRNSYAESCNDDENGILSVSRSIISTIPYQVQLTDEDVLKIIYTCIDASKNKPSQSPKHWGQYPPSTKILKMKLHHSGASTKVNVTFDQMIRGLYNFMPIVFSEISKYSKFIEDNLTDDQGAALCLYLSGISVKFNCRYRMLIALLPFYDLDMAKSLSTLLKAIGANSHVNGAVVCEMNTMLGRGVAEINPIEEALKRTRRSCIPKTGIDDDVLRASIVKIIKSELDYTKLKFQDPLEFWETRWLWCANGAHNKALGRHNHKLDLKYKKRMYRKVAAEYWKDDPTDGWDSRVIVTPSGKLEHGKTRLLLSCDTVSYMAFEHLLGGVEDAWQNKRVVLDPGSLTVDTVRTRLEIDKFKGYHYMALDYDDFNSQHTLLAQKMVVEETVKLTGYDQKRGDKLISSFDNMWLHTGNTTAKIVGTLMSGHRGTTYLNSILNAAYIDAATKGSYGLFDSLHVGDDVMIKTMNADMVDKISSCLKTTNLKLNPAKQSIGQYAIELLRISHKISSSIAYFSRSVSSAVSGNWVSEKSLDAKEALTNAVTSCWTLMNRCGSDGPVKLLGYTIAKKFSLDLWTTMDLCKGIASLNGGPIRQLTGTHILKVSLKMRTDDEGLENYEDAQIIHNATNDYIRTSVTGVENLVLERMPKLVKKAMITSSYLKSEREPGITDGDLIAIEKKILAPASLSITSAEAMKKKRVSGVLEKYPLLVLMKDRITKTLRGELLKLVCGSDALNTTVRAWGLNASPCIIYSHIPYSDAASICARGESLIVRNHVNYYV